MMNWNALDVQGKGPPEFVPIKVSQLVCSITGDVSFFRAIENLSRAASVALNIVFLLAFMSVFPTLSFLLALCDGWSDGSLAASRLLAEVLDPVGYLSRILQPSSVPMLSKKRHPVQKMRLVTFALIALAAMIAEVMFIVGQAGRERPVALPYDQVLFRITSAQDIFIGSSSFESDL